MALILQRQRRAIEALKPFVEKSWPSESFTEGHVSFYIGEGPTQTPSLVFLGFSEGIGTCSDIHGMDVAVLGYRALGNEKEKDLDIKRLAGCAYVVLFWPVHAIEVKVLAEKSERVRLIDLDHDLQAPKATVELLRFHSSQSFELTSNSGNQNYTMTYFQRTGLVASYVVLYYSNTAVFMAEVATPRLLN